MLIAIEETPDNWDVAVEKGRELVALDTDCKWQLGELALEVAPIASHGGDHNGETGKRLNHFAIAIGIDYEALDKYRHVAAKWPVKWRRSDLAWSVHLALASVDNRESLIRSRESLTVREARALARARRSDTLDAWESFNADSLEPPGGVCPCCWSDLAGAA